MKKLHSAAFALLTIAVCIGIAAAVILIVLFFIDLWPIFDAGSSVTADTVIAAFLSGGGLYFVQLTLGIIWFVCLLRDRKKPTRRAYIMIMCGFHIFYFVQNISKLSAFLFLTNRFGPLSMANINVPELIQLILIFLLPIADILVFIGYGVQKRAPAPVKKKIAVQQRAVPPRQSYPPQQSYPAQHYSYPPPQQSYPPPQQNSYPPPYNPYPPDRNE
jgi:hypothetical protein